MEVNKIDTAKITSEFIEAQSADIKALVQKTQEAADAYMADLSLRKAELEKQAADYREQIETKKKQRKGLADKINDLSSRGMIDEAAEADMELEALDKAISTLKRKIKLVRAAELKGDPELYKAAHDANAAMVDGQTAYKKHLLALRFAVNEEIDRLKKIEKELWYAADSNPGYHAGNAFQKVVRHYMGYDRIEQEGKERPVQEAERGHTRIALSMR